MWTKLATQSKKGVNLHRKSIWYEKVDCEEELRDFLIFIASEKGLAIQTIEAYERDLRSFLSCLKREKLSLVESSDIISFIEQMGHKGYASSTRCRFLVSMKVFFRFLKREKWIETDPTHLIEFPKLWKLLPEIMTEEEVEQLMRQPNLHSMIGARDRAIFEILYATGMRVSELCNLNLHDVDERAVCVRGKGGKERMIPIAKVAIECLDLYLAFRSDLKQFESPPLFITKRGKRIGRVQVWSQMKKYARAAGIKREVSPHTLRHCFATHLLDHGADIRIIQEFLGHADISTTDQYTHLSNRQLHLTFDAFHPRP